MSIKNEENVRKIIVIFPIFSYTFQIEAETCVSASKSFMRFL